VRSFDEITHELLFLDLRWCLTHTPTPMVRPEFRYFASVEDGTTFGQENAEGPLEALEGALVNYRRGALLKRAGIGSHGSGEPAS